MKVLCVEPDLAHLNLMESLLAQRPGATMLFAVQGRTALRLALEHAPALVLLALRLPDMPGEEVLARLRADARTAHTPVVVVGAGVCEETVARLRAAGADACLPPPCHFLDFAAAVAPFLDAPAPDPHGSVD